MKKGEYGNPSAFLLLSFVACQSGTDGSTSVCMKRVAKRDHGKEGEAQGRNVLCISDAFFMMTAWKGFNRLSAERMCKD